MLKIKELREAINMTQDQVVEITGIPKRSYVNYENGITDIPLSKLQNIASALNVAIGDLVDETKKENPKSEEVIFISDFSQVAIPNVKENPIVLNDRKNDRENDRKPNVIKNPIILDGKENGKEEGNEPNVKKNVTILQTTPTKRTTPYTHQDLQVIARGGLRVPKGTGVLNQPLQALAVDNFEGLGNLEPIPLVNEVAAAGYFGGGFSIEKEDVMRYYVVPDFKQVDFMIRVVGSSMYPKYNPGDIIAVRVLYERNFIQWNKTHLFSTREQGLIVKRPKKHPDPNFVTMVSDNKEYDPFDVYWEDIFGVAIIIGTIRAEG